jgi:hypothetical protein
MAATNREAVATDADEPWANAVLRAFAAQFAEALSAHDSDCARHNEPAYPNGPCNCSQGESRLEGCWPLRTACQRMIDDYQTSEGRHPNHILITKDCFEDMRAAIALPALSGISLDGCQGEPAGMMTVKAHFADGSEQVLIADNGNVISHWKNVSGLSCEPPSALTQGESRQNGWQDIATAPKDGRWLLLEGEMSGGDTSSVRVGRWSPHYSEATRCTYEWQCVDPYAHGTEDEMVGPDAFWNWHSEGRVSGWQPLPAAPTPADGGGE